MGWARLTIFGFLEHLRQQFFLLTRRKGLQEMHGAGGAGELVADLISAALVELVAQDPALALETVNDLPTHDL
jgi:hypothetical protein